jgi:hypothetical protein
VERTQIVLGDMTPMLLVLWRNKNPDGKERLHLPLDLELSKETGEIMFEVGLRIEGLMHKDEWCSDDVQKTLTNPILLLYAAGHH